MPSTGVFASVSFADPFGIFNSPEGSTLKILYQGEPTGNNGGTVLPGDGKFEFFNIATGTKVLDTTLNISTGPKKTYYLYKPNPEKEKITFIENNQASEPGAKEDHIKIKIANFTQSRFGNINIKIVFTQRDASGTYVAIDTIQTTGSNYTAYNEIKRLFTERRGVKTPTYSYRIGFLDENDALLTGSVEWDSRDSNAINRVYTLFVTPLANTDFLVTTLFVN